VFIFLFTHSFRELHPLSLRRVSKMLVYNSSAPPVRWFLLSLQPLARDEILFENPFLPIRGKRRGFSPFFQYSSDAILVYSLCPRSLSL